LKNFIRNLPYFVPTALTSLTLDPNLAFFLGYQFAGYKCLDPVTNKVYHSRHVVFDESSFLAKDPATSLLPSQLPSTGISHLLVYIIPAHFLLTLLLSF